LRFCVVGLGNHARTKLIPALVANGQQIVGIVTSQSNPLPLPTFHHLDAALSALPPDTVFVIATPPAVHFKQAILAIEAGRDVILEKPAFVTRLQAVTAVAESARRGTALAEAFMYRHTRLYRRLTAYWQAQRHCIDAIDITFVVPELPPGTFRQNGDVACSGMYDIGCYAIALLIDLDLPLHALDLREVDFPGDHRREALRLNGVLGGVHANIRIGVSADYVNTVVFQTKDGETTTFSPFFHGRPGEKVISYASASATSLEGVRDGNAFEEMLAVPRQIWLDGQPQRTQRMIEVATTLTRLGDELEMFRKRGGC
jgi:hypothetical protein